MLVLRLTFTFILVLAAADAIVTNSWEPTGALPYRQLIFENNKKKIVQHNSNPQRSFDMRLYPQFAGRTIEQNAKLFLNKNPITKIQDIKTIPNGKAVTIQKIIDKVGAVYQIDLRTYTPIVTNQQSCGNCYAVSTVDCVNTLNRIRAKSTPSLSVEELTACSSNQNLTYSNLGCNGGDLQISMWYMTSYGIHSAADYPTTVSTLAGIAQPCRLLPAQPTYKIAGWGTVNPDSGTCFNRANLLLRGIPVVTAMFAGNAAVLYYSSGIITGCPASATLLDHAVLMVGVMYDGTSKSYMTIKNSWGSSWGMGGFFKVAFGNVCNTCIYSVLPYV